MSQQQNQPPSRRGLLVGAVTSAGGLAVAGRLAQSYGLVPPDANGLFAPGAALTYGAQRLLTRHSLARELPASQISNPPMANGKPPDTADFLAHRARGFADWRLVVDGLVDRPGAFPVDEIRARFPRRTQITQLACEEGWCFTAEWIGAPLHFLLEAAGIQPHARFVVYRSIQQRWWDSIDMADALHPQTFVAYGMNGGELPIGNGGPLRLRVPRHLGYKSLKYLTRITVTDSLQGLGNGSNASNRGYQWFAGI